MPMKKTQTEVSNDMDAFNSGNSAPSDEKLAYGAFKAVVKVTLFQMQTIKSKGEDREVIKIQLEGEDQDGAQFTAWKNQYLNRDQNGKLKNWMYEGGEAKDGTIILPSVAWELKELAKAYMGESKYIELKQRLGEGKLTRSVFEALELEMTFKRITSKETGEEYIIPMFAYDRQKDEEYQKNKPTDEEVDPVEADKAIQDMENEDEPADESSIDPNDLPF